MLSDLTLTAEDSTILPTPNRSINRVSSGEALNVPDLILAT